MLGFPAAILGLAGLLACSSSPPSTPPERLEGTSWRVFSLNGGSVQSLRVTIQFDEQGQVVGNASCNDYRFGYWLENGQLRFAETVTMTTERVCDLEALKVEERFLATLGEVRRAAFARGTLVLYATPTGRIVARPA
jgi:heat shock protein HslJ